MTTKQISELLKDDLLQFLPQEGKLLAERKEEDATVLLFLYCETLIEVFFSLEDDELMGSSQIESKERLEPYLKLNALSDFNALNLL